SVRLGHRAAAAGHAGLSQFSHPTHVRSRRPGLPPTPRRSDVARTGRGRQAGAPTGLPLGVPPGAAGCRDYSAPTSAATPAITDTTGGTSTMAMRIAWTLRNAVAWRAASWARGSFATRW